MKTNSEPIDFVIPWVNPNDIEWQILRKKYSEDKLIQEDSGSNRYRDMGTLRYLFRSIENNAPWVNKVHFVTCNQIPEWLNINHPQINIVNHKDYIPLEFLPTFSSSAIEFNYHRIRGISNNIVCFNDDTFVIKPTIDTDFFVHDIPCDAPCMCFVPVSSIHFLAPMINVLFINKHFSKRNTINKHPLKWYNIRYGKRLLRNVQLIPSNKFTGFINAHVPFSIKKHTLQEIWEEEPEAVQLACEHKFRNELDINIWLTSYWQYAKNDFCPRNPKIGRYIGLTDDMINNKMKIEHAIKGKTKLVCLNDELTTDEAFDSASIIVKNALESLFPRKSSFELF